MTLKFYFGSISLIFDKKLKGTRVAFELMIYGKLYYRMQQKFKNLKKRRIKESKGHK